jgi:CRISPR/Cas system endoribonuclease Cas6 (RAMP superfamily)
MSDLVYLRALFTYLLSPPLSHRPPHAETDSVGAAPLSYSNLVTYHAWFRRKTLKREFKSTNYKHENAGAGLSYSGRNGQWSLPY